MHALAALETAWDTELLVYDGDAWSAHGVAAILQ
jgi:hypothetical protein